MKPELKVGDVVITGYPAARFGDPEKGLCIRRVAKVTSTQVEFEDGARFHKGGTRIGGAERILRLATKEDFDRDQAKHETADAIRKQIRADHEHRDILAGLFPDDIRPTVMLPSSNQPGEFNLEFHNLTEETIRRFADLLKDVGK